MCTYMAEESLYDNEVYRLHMLNECKRVAEICYILLCKGVEDGDELDYYSLLELVLEELRAFPEDEKIELTPAEVQLMCMRSHDSFNIELRHILEDIKREDPL